MADHTSSGAIIIQMKPEHAQLAIAAFDAVGDNYDDWAARIADAKDPIKELSDFVSGEPKEIIIASQFFLRHLVMEDYQLFNAGHFDIGFNYQIDDDGLFIGADDDFNIDHAAIASQCILKFFNMDEPILIESANNCSKLRPRSHSGDTVFITKDKMDWMSTSYWLKEKLDEYNQSKK